MNYFDAVCHRLDELIPGNDPALIRYYAVLALTTGVTTTRKDVHNAWAAWRTVTKPEHPDLIPLDELTEEIKAYDDPYVEAIRKVAGNI